MRLVPLAMLIVACGRDNSRLIDSASAVSGQSEAAVVSSDQTSDVGRRTSGGTVKPPCPTTGTWAPCNVFDRLDRAGLAPRTDTTPVSNPVLSPRGVQLLVGNARLQLFVYPDVRTREREQGKLDRAKYVSFGAPTMQSQPTLIYNTNLIAILFSRNDHLRERVSDAITAGPPQPPSSQPPSTP